MADIPVDEAAGRSDEGRADAAAAGAPTAAQSDAGFWPNKGGAYYSLFLLAGCVMFTILDRQVLALMIEPVKQDFGISDTQAALVLGAAFSMTYAVCGVPIARVADNWNRKGVIAISVAFWSFCTVLCGVSQNYLQLFIARMGIGAGESGYAPATWSVLTDSFPREKLAIATGTLGIGNQIGAGLALIIGGSALHLVSQFPPVELPLIGTLRPWQWAFIIVGAPGMLWALLLAFTMKEPPRRGALKIAEQKKNAVPVSAVFKFMFDDWKCYGPILASKCTKVLLSMGTVAWMPTLFRREFDWDLTKIGLVQGSVLFVVAPAALIMGGKLSERWTKQGMWEANLRIVSYTMTGMIPLTIIFPLIPNPWLCVSLFGLTQFVAMLGFGPAAASLQLVSPNQMRSQISAVSLFMSNVLGYALGPLIVALFTDYLFSDPQDLKYSMSLCAAILAPLAAAITWYGVKPYGRSVQRAAAEFA